MATIGAKALQKRGQLPNLDESEEINACTVKVTVDNEPWLSFQNETHNHPTEIEPRRRGNLSRRRYSGSAFGRGYFIPCA